ncbi:unnamed protein product, partial [Discosporangium mesarthrocarpum]
MFQEVDEEGKGYLTLRQLSSVMSAAGLGISASELQLVLAEADENSDGCIDYYEFIPLALNLAHAFRARRKAQEELGVMQLELDREAVQAVFGHEFGEVISQLRGWCEGLDPGRRGAIPRADFKNLMADPRLGLTKIEASLLVNAMPHGDPQQGGGGMIDYRKLAAGMEQVRFTTIRNAMAEASATDTSKYLMDMCREEEAKKHPVSDMSTQQSMGYVVRAAPFTFSGPMLRAHQLTSLLLNAPMLSLSRLHVMVLMSETRVLDGMVNYVEQVSL